MKTHTKLGVAALAATLSVGLVSCSSGNGGGGSGDNGGSESAEIGFSVPFLTDAFQVQLVNGLESEAAGSDFTLLPAVDAQGDPARQNEDVSTLLTRGIKGLVIGAVDSKAIVPAIEKANEAGVPVVAMDLGADGGEIAMVVRADNLRMGRDSCMELGSRIEGGGKVLNLQGMLTSQNGRDRDSGFVDCMAENFPEIEVISRPMEWSAEQCADQAKTVISSTDLVGVYMASDNLCIIPVVEALKAEGKLFKVGEAGHIPLVGIDGAPHALDAVRDGHLDVSVSQPNDLYTKWAWFYITAFVNGETFEVGPTDHDSEIVQFGNSLADQLPATIVTQENVDDPKLWGNS